MQVISRLVSEARSNSVIGRFSGLSRRPATSAFLLISPFAYGCGVGSETTPRDEIEAPWTLCSADSPNLPQAFDQIDGNLRSRQGEEDIPGLAAGIVCGDSLVWSKGYGVWSLDDSRPVEADTPFRIASLTKMFTATAIMSLREAGHLSLRDSAEEHLPWFQIGRPPETGTAPITILHLLTHTSGVPRDSRLTDFGRLYQPSPDDAIAAVPDESLQHPPGDVLSYSNLGYGLLGEVVGAAGGSTYADYLQQEVLGPLGMGETLVHPSARDETAWGHGPRRGDEPRSRAGFWDLGFATPAGGMASSVTDLSRFVVLQLAPYLDREPVLLTREALFEMHRVHHMIDANRGGTGLGWAVEVSRGQHVIYHGGELPEQTAFMLIDLKSAIGIIVLSNAQGVDTSGIAQEGLRVMREAVIGGIDFPTEAIPPT